MMAYAGDITSAQAWTMMAEQDALLVDVRTHAEWTFVGVPDLSSLGRDPILVEWQSYPEMALDPNFATRVQEQLQAAGAATETPILFLCRSGGRSRSAAMVMTDLGYSTCFNIADGFDGDLDAARHRGTASGWKATGLPWVQG